MAATSVPTLDLNAAIVLDAAVDLEITELPRAVNLDAVAELGTDFATGVDSDMMVGLDTTENSVEAQASAVSLLSPVWLLTRISLWTWKPMLSQKS